MIRLVNVCEYYRGLSHQNSALDFLEQNIPTDVLEQFAAAYRNDSNNNPIKLSDAAKYYLALPHQRRALEELQAQIPEQVLNQFAEQYRNSKPAPQPSSQSSSRSSRLIKLDVPYRSQLDNDQRYHGPGYRQCNLTSHTMLLLAISDQFRKQSASYNEPETYYGEILNRYGDTTDHNAHTQALLQFGIRSRWVTNGTYHQIRESLERGIPVVAGVKYRSSGHIIVIVGDDPDNRYYLVHDPYGTRIGASDEYRVGVGGAYDQYTYQTMNQILFDDNNTSSAWIRIVDSF